MLNLRFVLIVVFSLLVSATLFPSCSDSPQLELTIVDQRTHFSLEQSFFSITVQNTGKSVINYAEVELEYNDNRGHNKIQLFAFTDLDVGERSTTIGTIDVDPFGEHEYFYFNLNITKVE